VQSQNIASSDPRWDLYFIPFLIGVFALLAFAVMARTDDPLMSMQAWTFMVGLAVFALWLMGRYADGAPAEDSAPYANDIVKAGVIASMIWGIAG
jgi:cytochrome c oxidase cbb3-type subunit 1